MDCSTPGFCPSLSAKTRVHWISDAIQPSHPLSPPSPPAFSLPQNQGLFQWVGSSHQVAKGLELQLQHHFFQWIFRTDFLYDGLVWSPCSPVDPQESSPTPQFKSISSLVLSFLYSPTLTSIMTTGKTIALTRWTFVGKVMSLLFNMLSAAAKSLQSCPTLCDPIDGSPPGPCQSLGFSRQEHWSVLPFPSPMH